MSFMPLVIVLLLVGTWRYRKASHLLHDVMMNKVAIINSIFMINDISNQSLTLNKSISSFHNFNTLHTIWLRRLSLFGPNFINEVLVDCVERVTSLHGMESCGIVWEGIVQPYLGESVVQITERSERNNLWIDSNTTMGWQRLNAMMSAIYWPRW